MADLSQREADARFFALAHQCCDEWTAELDVMEREGITLRLHELERLTSDMERMDARGNA